MTERRSISWTDGRVISVAVVASIAAITAITGSGAAPAHVSLGPIATETSTLAPQPMNTRVVELPTAGAPETGTADWALALLQELDSYEQPPGETYDRDSYDRGWLDLDRDCQSGRHEVLIFESLAPVTLDDDGCRVISGRWIDPYDGTPVGEAIGVSIDHVVALAEAHRSGGWRWTGPWRVAFANDLDDPATLAVSATSVNQAKGSDAPDRWMPIGSEARCTYAVAWVRVKTRWQLDVTSSERAALEQALTTCVRQGSPANVESRPLIVVDFDGPGVGPESPVAARFDKDGCDMRYESVCIPVATDDLDCLDVDAQSFDVTTDPHRFDGDDNGVGCER